MFHWPPSELWELEAHEIEFWLEAAIELREAEERGMRQALRR